MTTELATTTPVDLVKDHGIQPKTLEALQKIEEIVARVNSPEVADMPAMTQTIVMAAGMRDLREALTIDLVKQIFMPLQGTKLGFRTDQDSKSGYPPEVVQIVMLEALLRGLRPIGNEVNIIGGNLYITKEGMDRLVREWPGMANLDLTPSVPVVKEGSAVVGFDASWIVNGKPDYLAAHASKDPETGEIKDQRIPVRINAGQGPDAILGKAERKMLARIYKRLSGRTLPDGDVIDTTGEAVVMDKRAQGTDGAAKALVDKHATKPAAASVAAPAAETPPAEPKKPAREPGEEG
jgi:hypothetical protein